MPMTSRLPPRTERNGKPQPKFPLSAATESLPASALHHVFERTCDAKPNALALICGRERLRYAELEARANRLARHLVRNGVRPGNRVGLLLERSVHTYEALLGVLKCGATFVPLDPAFPAERIAFIAGDAGLGALVTTANFGDAAAGMQCPVLALDHDRAAIAAEPDARPAVAIGSDALCYILYTSGTTGRPKGVGVTHANICNFLRACTPIYGVTVGDKVYQGMTLAFDFSVEEIWPTFAAGATLVAGPTDHRRFGSGLWEFLVEQRITVVCCVPTLLATLERDVPTLRTLLVGGEACPADLVARWSRPCRRMLNTYGPTETTVTATWGELLPGKPVTIGTPLPTYSVHILDEALQPLAEGQDGEICIGGPGVAVGYIGRPELTAEKFVLDPFTRSPGSRLYRTGDLGRITPDGKIEYLGRLDSQVKIRGHRIELGEIETLLLADAAVANALVALVVAGGGTPELAAYITLRGAAEDVAELRCRLHEVLRRRLPGYMVPAFIEILAGLPTLPSGKADRARLPAPSSPRLGTHTGDEAPPATPLEHQLAAAWSKAFGRGDLSVTADFFLELGGHSLLAAQVISGLRHDASLRRLGIGDLYAHPTIRGLAGHIKANEPRYQAVAASQSLEMRALRRRRHGTLRVLACGLGQGALLYLLFVVLALPVQLLLGGGQRTPTNIAARAALALFIMVAAALALPIVGKWLLIGRFREGRYPLWGWYYCRWWLVRKLLTLVPVDYLSGSPLAAPYLRLLGARVGRGCHLGSGLLGLPDLLEIGEGASIGYGVVLEPFSVEDGWLVQRPIRIGAGAFLGANAVVMLGGTVGRNARVAEQSLVSRRQTIPEGETWAGSPSRRVASDPRIDTMAACPGPQRWPVLVGIAFAACALLLELLPSLLLVPGLLLLYVASEGALLPALALAPAAGLFFVLATCAAVALGKRLVLRGARPGVFPLRSWFGLRKWLADKLMLTSLTTTNTLYATLYTNPWLRLLGARVGARSEVSTVSNIDPDLLTIGPESFVADMAVLGPARYCNGLIALGSTELGSRCFVGNAALVPGDTHLGHGSLIGVQSVPPAGPVEPGTSWLGSPAIYLPRRQASARFDDARTFRPPARLVAGRLAVEFLRVVLPATLMYVLILTAAAAFFRLADALPWPLLLAVLPGVYLACALLVTLVVVALKWLVAGRYRPRVEPLWSHFVWRTELITGLYESVAVPWLLRWCTGTPWLAPLLRLFGAHIGRRVYMETTFLTEFDLVCVGDDAAIGGGTSLQTHLFEDRVMKMSEVTIGRDCVVGPRSVVLYDAELEAGAELSALSLAMKGESLPAETRWRGIPARLIE